MNGHTLRQNKSIFYGLKLYTQRQRTHRGNAGSGIRDLISASTAHRAYFMAAISNVSEDSEVNFTVKVRFENLLNLLYILFLPNTYLHELQNFQHFTMRSFVSAVISASEKAALIARACRQEDDLFQMLIQVRYII